MTKTDLPRLARVMELLGATFNEKISELRVEGYLMGLSDLSIDDVECGARRALKECKFFPRPAELRELAIGSDDDASEIAWLELQREIRRVGAYGTPVLAPSVHAAMTLVWGSWANLCATLPAESPELLGWAKRFKKTFETVQHQDQRHLEGMSRRLLDA